MLQKFTSVKTTFICLGLLIGSLLAGVGLTLDKSHAVALKSLGRQLPLTWLFYEAAGNSVIATWFVMVCLVGGIFLIHLASCVMLRLFRLVQNGFSTRQFLFLLIHILFGLVMICHGISMAVGYKQSDIKMFAGNSTRLDNTYKLSVSEVRFGDDPALLKASFENQRALMSRENIHREKNYAHVTLTDGSRILSSGRAYVLSPLRAGSIRVTLTEFFIQGDSAEDTIGVKLTVTKNPVIPFFFITYAGMILSLIGFIVITRRNEKMPELP